MPRKSPPAFVQLLIFFVVCVAFIWIGGQFMRRTLIRAEIVVDNLGVTVVNENEKNWPGGVIYLNEPEAGLEAVLPPLEPGEPFKMPFAVFETYFQRNDVDKIVIREVSIAEMKGFQDRTFDVRDVAIHAPLPYPQEL